jgi:hypothetical protein
MILYCHLMTEAELASETRCVLINRQKKISKNMYQFKTLVLCSKLTLNLQQLQILRLL